jgi:hypothetical protein
MAHLPRLGNLAFYGDCSFHAHMRTWMSIQSTPIILLLIGMLGSIASIGDKSESQSQITEHIIWERDFPDLQVSTLDGAVSDKDGVLWIATYHDHISRLLRFSPDGNLLTNCELSSALAPEAPATVVYFSLAASPTGKIGMVAQYSHAIGKAIYSDGSKFAIVNSAGQLDVSTQLTKSGGLFSKIIALENEDFFVSGDQEPMGIARVSPNGIIEWQKEFPRNWVLPTMSELESGKLCIGNVKYAAPRAHITQLSASGIALHRAEFEARRLDIAAGPQGICAALYDTEPKLLRSEYFLTAFGPTLKRLWTAPIELKGQQGSTYGLLSLADGYLVWAEARGGSLFIAKYSFSGQLVWSALDKNRQSTKLAVPAKNGFYMIGACLHGSSGLHLIRGQ